jgi:hypothetical protein
MRFCFAFFGLDERYQDITSVANQTPITPIAVSGANTSKSHVMKAWQIFGAGTAVLMAALLLPAYEAFLAGLAAVAMVGIVVVGFFLRPRKEMFYLRTTLVVSEPEYPLCVEHDRVAVRVEIVRLWLLFLPTFAAVAFLILTSTKGTTWNFTILDKFCDIPYVLLLGIRAFLIIVVGLLSTWTSERWVLRDAEACSADSVSEMAGRFLYSFRDHSGEYYGGEGFPFCLVRSPKLARIVFYRVTKPQLNKIAMSCLFHRVVIVGKGLTDLDSATVRAVEVQPVQQLFWRTDRHVLSDSGSPTVNDYKH